MNDLLALAGVMLAVAYWWSPALIISGVVLVAAATVGARA